VDPTLVVVFEGLVRDMMARNPDALDRLREGAVDATRLVVFRDAPQVAESADGADR
jgi:hypothetical protein